MSYRSASDAEGVFETYVFEKNIFGDIVAVYDLNGNKLVSYKYDAWGNFTTSYHNGTTSTSIAARNPFKYRGYYYDSDLGLYYLQTRYYDSVTGRFINADGYVSTGQGMLGNNMFAYCNNNPVMFTDPTGELPALAIVGIVAAAVVVTAVVVTGINHITNAVMKSKIDDQLEESYTKEQAVEEIGKVVGVENISIDENGAQIKYSKDIESRYDRLYVSTILSRTEGFDRSATNISAEWAGHNFVYFFTHGDDVRDVDIEFQKDGRWGVRAATKALQILGWC